ncbi:MAG: hypothetical protein JHC33_12630 [Ignisphaera sp.]|nr:hypothetical protein [Ignisphaera sp.]
MAIELATTQDIIPIACMMQLMTAELDPTGASSNLDDYIAETVSSFVNPKHYIYVVKDIGFMIVTDETSITRPNSKTLNGFKLYILPKYRGGRLLHNLYARAFIDFPEHDILCVAEANSPHEAVMAKRQEHVLTVYKLKRN